MMRLNFLRTFNWPILVAVMLAPPILAQNARVEVAKRSGRIPKSCQLLTPANLDGMVDVPALMKEAICKGAGDMLTEYMYTMNSVRREKDKNGKLRNEETFVYEVFIPTLKSGTRTKGVLVVTSHNGEAVPPADLEEDRKQAAERIEKEEERIAKAKSEAAPPESDNIKGMEPVGMYTRTSVTHSVFGMKRASATLAVADFLRASDLTLSRRQSVDGRDTLIFNFASRPGTQFTDNEKYMAQITGEIWIDATDRIVTRLIGWPVTTASSTSAAARSGDKVETSATGVATERPPAVYVEMMRLPQPGIWLPRIVRLNGADYQKLFDGITTDSTSTYSNYIRFSTEVKDVEVKPLKNP
jgi:hypothetical protein